MVDPRLRDDVRRDLQGASASRVPPLAEDRRWVIAGHRAAGKSSLMRMLARVVPRPAVDLDEELARRAGRPLREWVREDLKGFRAAEREVFSSLPTRTLVSVGGGFLSLNPDLLEDAELLVVPITFETYAERLRRDNSRPRLRPEVPLEEELRGLWEEREALHAKVPARRLGVALAALEASLRG